ncbi:MULTISPECIES: hypothetical protein [unclassified Cupriavidus]|uniref:hypothetical protein n=1 Tax=unclassified Cupriavidus TaxID=2640874 RepID=UPI00313CD75C
MFHPLDILNCIFDTFDQGLLKDFQGFLAGKKHVSKWMIAADFCIDAKRPNTIFAFSVLPHDAAPESIQRKIASSLPSDWKSSRDLTEAATSILRSDEYYHFCFVLDRKYKYFQDENGNSSPRNAKKAIEKTLSLIRKKASQETLTRAYKLRQESLKKNFSTSLASQICLFSIFYSFITLALLRERKSELIGWFPDRDKITEYCDGVAWDFLNYNVAGMAEKLGISIAGVEFGNAIPDPTQRPEDAMWFDEMIRLPDYLASPLSVLDLTKNELVVDKKKYSDALNNVFVGTQNIAVFRLHIKPGSAQAARLSIQAADEAQDGWDNVPPHKSQ